MMQTTSGGAPGPDGWGGPAPDPVPGPAPGPAPAPGYAPASAPAGPPERTPPVKVALALVVVTALTVLTDLAGYLWLLTPWPSGSVVPDESTFILLAVVVIVVALASFALWITTVVLSILVLVWGRGAMRLGALFVLIPVTISTFVSADVSGDSAGADAARSVLGAIAITADLVGIALAVVGIVLLLRGIREARRV